MALGGMSYLKPLTELIVSTWYGLGITSCCLTLASAGHRRQVSWLVMFDV
jgi:hypothetical protein